jgi:hypothetical protein
MSLTDLSNVAFTSTKPTDKIVGVYEGSFAPGSATIVGDAFLVQLRQHLIPHTFDRPVFTKLLISTDNSIWQDGGATSNGISYSDSSNIAILTDRTTGTLYYKVIAFWIDDYDGTNPLVPPTVGSSSQVYFDSRLNYQKVATQEVFSLASGVGPNTATITHNLGYKPNARVFVEAFAGQVWPANFGGVANKWYMEFNQLECAYAIEDNTVVIQTFGGISSPSHRAWGVVYHDE